MGYTGETKLFECESGKVYAFPKTHCVFCKHCTDLLYDYTNGPYMFMCEFGLEPDITEAECICERFEDDGYEFDAAEYEARMKTISEFMQSIKDNKDFQELMDKLTEKIIFGNSNISDDETIESIWEMKGE